MYEFEYFRHRRRRERRWSFREPSYEFVEEFFRADLKVEWVSAILHENVEQLNSLNVSSRIASRIQRERGGDSREELALQHDCFDDSPNEQFRPQLPSV